MISIRKKAHADVPEILTTKGLIASKDLLDRFNAGETDFLTTDFDSSIYGHPKVKEALANIQDGKCCFCESKFLHVSYGDVEHFRPKAGWIQSNEALNKPGYFWLAYDFDNLLLSCQLCNQRYKRNFFPLLQNSQRAFTNQLDIRVEKPLFIHPANENPQDFITFKEEIPVAVNGNIRGDETIKKLGLDRELLNEQRRRILAKVRDIYELAKGYPDTNLALKQKAKNKIEKYFNESKLDETEYSSMLQAFFKNNPINF